MFCLMTHSTHFTLQLYGVKHMVKEHSYSERGNPLPPHGLLFLINSKGSFISHREDSTYHGLCYTPVVEHWLERDYLIRQYMYYLVLLNSRSFFNLVEHWLEREIWCNKGCGMCYPVWDDAYKRTLAANR